MCLGVGTGGHGGVFDVKIFLERGERGVGKVDIRQCSAEAPASSISAAAVGPATAVAAASTTVSSSTAAATAVVAHVLEWGGRGNDEGEAARPRRVLLVKIMVVIFVKVDYVGDNSALGVSAHQRAVGIRPHANAEARTRINVR